METLGETVAKVVDRLCKRVAENELKTLCD